VSEQNFHLDTKLVNLGRPAHVAGAPMNVPIGLSSTFIAGENSHGYVREGTDLTEAFESVIGSVEGGHSVVFSSGIATINAVVDLLPANAIVVAPNHAYPGNSVRLRELAAVNRIQLREVQIDDIDEIRETITGAALLWLESPTNPLMEIVDLKAAIKLGHSQNALVAIDNTFMSLVRQQPLALGADISMHSATKSISGHSDSLIGVLTVKDEELAQKLRGRRVLQGTLPGALETFLALRGIRTLGLRYDRAEQNALELAKKLEAHSAVDYVLYPGLASHKNHERHMGQASGGGQVVCFVLKGDVEQAEKFCNSLKIWAHATSLGGVESTIERRRRWPVEPIATPETLIRASVGIEKAEDLWADLDSALKSVYKN
jgi:cystathionine gamma-synthase